MKTMHQDNMKRGEFLRSLGLSTSTLMAFYCLGTTMTACGSDEPDPVDPGDGGNGIAGTTTGGAINFTVDLTKVTTLKTAGNFQLIGDVIVALASTGYVALSRRCTHEGSNVQYRLSQNDFLCPSHGSEFATTGAVQQGPASSPLTVYAATLSADGNTLTVKA